jgi:hypothetical protein
MSIEHDNLDSKRTAPEFEEVGAASLSNLHRSESGMMAWGTIFGVMVLLIFVAFITNSVDTVNQKIETQNAADSVAYSSAVWLARGMNAVTATNHIIGELNGVYIIHHALGGKRLDDQYEENTNSSPTFLQEATYGLQPTYGVTCQVLNTEIDIAFAIVQSAVIPAMSFHKSIIKDQDPRSDVNSTLFRGMRNLKAAYIQTLIVHAIGWGIWQIPDPFGISKIVGSIIMGVALVVEFKIWQEYLTLMGVEMLAKGTSIGKIMVPSIMDTIYIYQNVEVIAATPLRAYTAADTVAKFHGAKGFVRGDTPSELPTSVTGAIDAFSEFYPKLPVIKETTQKEKRNQLMRATFPWVAHWRYKPRRFFMYVCTMSWAAKEYTKWTNEWTSQSVARFRRKKSDGDYDKQLLKVDGKGQPKPEMRPLKNTPLVFDEGMKLYVMLDLNKTGDDGIHKSNEKWNEDSLTGSYRSDEIFSMMGFAKRPKSRIAAPAFFRQENPHGYVCYSQAMIYNANPQQEPADSGGDGAKQADVGWDTLNWDHTLSGSNPIEYVTDDDYQYPPRIKPNWQAKLTPLTATKMAKTITTAALSNSIFGDDDFAKVLLNNGLEQGVLQNH